MNAIKQLTPDVAAKIQYTIPVGGEFLVMWALRGIPYSGTYRYDPQSGELMVFVDGHGWVVAGKGKAYDYYNLHDLNQLADSGCIGVASFIGVIVVEFEGDNV